MEVLWVYVCMMHDQHFKNCELWILWVRGHMCFLRTMRLCALCQLCIILVCKKWFGSRTWTSEVRPQWTLRSLGFKGKTFGLKLLQAYIDPIGWSRSLQDRLILTNNPKVSLSKSDSIRTHCEIVTYHVLQDAPACFSFKWYYIARLSNKIHCIYVIYIDTYL